MSDRERQFKEFKLKCNALCKAATTTILQTPQTTSVLDAASSTPTIINQTLSELSSEMCKSYRSFPLLCSRTPQRFNEPEVETSIESGNVTNLITDDDAKKLKTTSSQGEIPDEIPTNETSIPTPDAGTTAAAASTASTTSTTVIDKKKKKKKKKKPPLPAWKRELQERRGLRISEPPPTSSAGETKGTTTEERSSVCRRTVAVSYNQQTHSVRWGVSGQLKNQRIHKSIWGKSLIKGRPRGTCAEFHVVNESLLENEQVKDMYLYVSDLIEGSHKPRCRNCLYILSDAQCFSDDLVFDGKTDKQSKFEWQGELTFKEET